MRSAKVRRAKLYFLRDLKGKAARMKEVKQQSSASVRSSAERAVARISAPGARIENAPAAYGFVQSPASTRWDAAAWPGRSWPAPSSSIPIATSPGSADSKAPHRPPTGSDLYDVISAQGRRLGVVSRRARRNRPHQHPQASLTRHAAGSDGAGAPARCRSGRCVPDSRPAAWPRRGIIGGDRKCVGHRGGVDRGQGDAGPADGVLHAADPRYGFDRHKGYATADHLAAVARFGYSAQHRRSFRPPTLFDTID